MLDSESKCLDLRTNWKKMTPDIIWDVIEVMINYRVDKINLVV